MSTDHYTVPCITLIGDSSIDHFQGVFYLAGRSCDYLFKYPFSVATFTIDPHSALSLFTISQTLNNYTHIYDYTYLGSYTYFGIVGIYCILTR